MALVQGKLLLAQGLLPEAWQQWGPLVQSAGSAAVPTVADTAWHLMVASYYKDGTDGNTPRFLHALTKTLTRNQVRLLQQLTRLQSRERLYNLLTIQPPDSILIPFLQLALGDRQVQQGQEQEAQAWWLKSQQWEATADEATRRLSSSSKEEPLRVGLLLPMGKKWAHIGEHLLHAAQKALSDFRDVPIQLRIADSGVSAETSREATNNLISQQVHVIVGPVFHASVQPAAEVAAKHGVPMITMNPHSETSQILSGVYSNALHPEQQARIMAHYAIQEKKYRRVVILAPESEYGHSMSKTFSDSVVAFGGSIVSVAYFPTNTSDFSPWLKQLKPDFDAVFLPAPAKHVRMLVPHAVAFGLDGAHVAWLGTALWNTPELLNEGAEHLNGAVFCDTSMEEKEWFRRAFRQSWEEEPTTLATLTYDGVAILAQLLRDQRLGGQVWSQGLTQAVGFQGASGPVQFLQNGQSRRNYHLFRVEDGRIRFLQPAVEPPSEPAIPEQPHK